MSSASSHIPISNASPPAPLISRPKLNERAAVIAAIFGTVSMLSIFGITCATLIITATQKITTIAATALIAKCLGLAALGAAGSLVVYGIPLIILIASMICMFSIKTTKTKIIDLVTSDLSGIEFPSKEIAKITKHLRKSEISEDQVATLFHRLTSENDDRLIPEDLLDALNTTEWQQQARSKPLSLPSEEEKQRYHQLMHEGPVQDRLLASEAIKQVIKERASQPRKTDLSTWISNIPLELKKIYFSLVLNAEFTPRQAMERVIKIQNEKSAEQKNA